MLEQARIIALDVYVSDLAVSRDFYERRLGLQVLEEDEDSVQYDGGQIILALKRAADYGIELSTVERDGAADVVFLVENLTELRDALERRGVAFNPTSWYEVGGIADFYDPDGHWLTLYQPSDEAMTWPSAEKIRAVMRARKGGSAASSSAAHRQPSGGSEAELVLDGKEVIYLFVFVEDPHATLTFYHHVLGLRDLEGGPCSQISRGDQDGVVKYDTGGILLSTHFIDDSRTIAEYEAHACPPRELDLQRMKGVAPTFHVSDIERVVSELSSRGVAFSGVAQSAGGKLAAFEDPSGHLYYLYEPSGQALQRPSGAKLAEILTAAF